MPEKTKISEILSQLSPMQTIGAILIGFITVVWGAFNFLDSRDDKLTEAVRKIDKLTENDAIEKEQLIILIDSVSSISDDVKGVKRDIKSVSGDVAGLKDSYVKFVKDNTKATDNFMKYMEGVLYEKKKNMSWTVLPPSD